MPDAPLLDPKAIADLRALSPDDGDALLRELVGLFLNDAPQRLQEIGAALAAGDSARAGRAAHAIKGSAANFGTARLTAAALLLEQRSRTDGPAALAPLAASLTTEFAAVRAALEDLVRPA